LPYRRLFLVPSKKAYYRIALHLSSTIPSFLQIIIRDETAAPRKMFCLREAAKSALGGLNVNRLRFQARRHYRHALAFVKRCSITRDNEYFVPLIAQAGSG
jgi:hypothetical protein